MTILTELKHRAALPEALHNRTPETLAPVLKWMTKHFNDPRYTPIIIDVMYQILGMQLLVIMLIPDIYGGDLLEDQNVAYLVEGITRKVTRGIEQVNQSKTLIGVLDMIAKY
jgi:U3 small nucleolar RNA-associated protein 15